MQPSRSYVLACTPRVGSHLLSDALTATGIAGRPREWLPRFTAETAPKTALDRMKLVTQPPPDVAYDAADDAERIRKFLSSGTTENGVFGVVFHSMVVPDAARRLGRFLDTAEPSPHRVFTAAFPDLSYVWVRRRDKVAQAVSWYKAIQTGVFTGKLGKDAGIEDELRFDYGKIRHLLSAVTSSENVWGSYFSSNGLTPLVLYYEDLSSQYVATVRSILDFLELDPAGSVDIPAPKREKYADALSKEWIEQFNLQHNQARSARR